VRTDIDVSRNRGVEKNGINTKIIGIVHFSFTVGKEASNYQLSGIVLSAMVITKPISQIDGFGLITGDCPLMNHQRQNVST